MRDSSIDSTLSSSPWSLLTLISHLCLFSLTSVTHCLRSPIAFSRHGRPVSSSLGIITRSLCLHLMFWTAQDSTLVECCCPGSGGLRLCILGKIIAEVTLGIFDVRQHVVSFSTHWKFYHWLLSFSGICRVLSIQLLFLSTSLWGAVLIFPSFPTSPLFPPLVSSYLACLSWLLCLLMSPSVSRYFMFRHNTMFQAHLVSSLL